MAQLSTVGWLVGWIYGISTFQVYLMPNPFLYKWVHSLIVKTFLFQAI